MDEIDTINWYDTKWFCFLNWTIWTYQVLTCASVIFNCLANEARSAEARYFCLWNRFSNSQICIRVNDVRGFFRFGGVRFWYGWPILRGGTGAMPGPSGKGTANDYAND